MSAPPMLLRDGDPSVRIAAAQILADVPDSQLPEGRQMARQIALQEYEASLAREADWPASNVNLGNLRRRQGRPDEALAAYERAIGLEPGLLLVRQGNKTGAYRELATTARLVGGLVICPAAATSAPLAIGAAWRALRCLLSWTACPPSFATWRGATPHFN